MRLFTDRLILLVALGLGSPLAAQIAPPPAPPLCEANSTNLHLQPGTGFCFEAAEQNGQATLIWGYPPDSENFLGSYVAQNPLIPPGSGDDTYNFEGFNVYQYQSSALREDERELIATYDVINGVRLIRDEIYDPEEGINQLRTVARGTDSGLRYHYEIEDLTNYTDYYYGISAYAYIDNELATGARVIESTPHHVAVRPSRIDAADGGSVVAGPRRMAIPGERIQGGGVGLLGVTIIDPTAVRDVTYTVRFYDFEGLDGRKQTTYDILRGTDELVNGAQTYDSTGALLGGIYQPYIGVSGRQEIIVDGLQFFISAPDPNVILPAYDADRVPDFSGNDVLYFDGFFDLDPDGDGIINTGGGIIEVSGTPCPNPGDYGCDTYDGLGNTVWHDPNPSGDYYMTVGGGAGQIDRLMRYIEALPPDQFEMRFTAAGGYGQYGFASGAIVSVPFELWNIGLTPDDPSDDVRWIPFINANGEELTDWENQFTGLDAWSDSPCAGGCPVTDWVYYMAPDRPDGYNLWKAAADGFGGSGAIYDATADGDTQEDLDPWTGGPCGNQGNYIAYCYRNQNFRLNGGLSSFIYPIGRTMIADLAGDGTTPPVGTVIRILSTPRPEIAAGDVFALNPAGFALVTGDATVAEQALDLISIVPNPYMGQSAYETGNLSRIARFTNLPETATIRIFTVAGTLVRTLTKDGPSRSLDWDLATDNDLPLASGMYLIHVDVPGVGERVLKFGLVQRRPRLGEF